MFWSQSSPRPRAAKRRVPSRRACLWTHSDQSTCGAWHDLITKHSHWLWVCARLNHQSACADSSGLSLRLWGSEGKCGRPSSVLERNAACESVENPLHVPVAPNSAWRHSGPATHHVCAGAGTQRCKSPGAGREWRRGGTGGRTDRLNLCGWSARADKEAGLRGRPRSALWAADSTAVGL